MASHRKPSGLASTSTVDLAGSAVVCPCHFCALYSGEGAQYAALVPFLKEGLEAGERALWFVDTDQRDERIERLSQGGIDVEAALKNGQLEVETWADVQLRGGRFDPERMTETIQEAIGTSRRRGFSRTRLWADMEWALTGAPGIEKLAVFESRLNFVLPLYGEAIVCAYDTTRFSEPLIEDFVRGHPHLLADGVAEHNPYYVPPELLVPEFESRDV